MRPKYSMAIHRGDVRPLIRQILTALVVVLLAIPMIAASGKAHTGALANYHGRVIDLSTSWHGAQACHFGDDASIGECFDSEAAMDQWLTSHDQGLDSVAATVPTPLTLPCASSLRLYDGTGYTGASLNLTTRAEWLNLSSYGFDQRTSSYKVGACSSKFADYANGGGSIYPTSLTQAYDQSTTMQSGWNNDVSSVYIY